MAEPLAAAPSGPAVPEHGVLLATKLHVPRPRPGFVPRPRLAERLDDGLAQGLVLVCAPAGYGKTTLLADWVQRGEHPVAWLSLDPADNDPARFWRHAWPRWTGRAPGSVTGGAAARPARPVLVPGLVTALINELADRPGGDLALLVLDDYHLIDAEPVHESLGFLLEYRPPGLGVVLTSRSDPPLALSRLRARGQLAELRAAELRFTPAEAAALLRQAPAGPGGPLSDAAVAALAARAEGWAAGLQLAALSLRGQPDVDGVRVGVHRQPPLRSGLPGRGGARAARASRCAPSCWRPRCWSGSQRRPVRRGHRPHREPGAAGAGGAGGPVPGAAR